MKLHWDVGKIKNTDVNDNDYYKLKVAYMTNFGMYVTH